MTFQPGESGNPNGRPKALNSAAFHARKHAEEAVQKLVDAMRSDDLTNSVKAANSLLDRGFGKPKETVGFETEDGQELKSLITIVFEQAKPSKDE